MLNQKIQNPNPDELMIEVDLCYELDPYELKLDEMIEAEPEPEMIEGLPASDALTPADRYLELFEHLQSAKNIPDRKTFPDCAPKMDPLDILIRYRKVRRHRDFDLRKFVENHFWLPEVYSSEYVSDPQNSLKEHIDQLWPVLTHEPQDHIPWSSLLALPQSYIVPGGRFSETYYWDSYFTMLGLAESGREDLLKCMADNFAWMIENYGHIPNGNRTYYLSRSQPPVFALMVELFEEDGVRGARRYLDHLKMEYAFWMDGAESLIPNQAYRHVVRMPDGSLLNRYWDDRDTPRDESWLEDVETAKHSGRPPNEVYRDLRAGAASGWDYSSRWLRDTGRLASIRTTQFIPIDLNAFLFKLESAIANAREKAAKAGEPFRENDLYIKETYVDEGVTLKRFLARAQGRAARINKRTSHITVVEANKEGARERWVRSSIRLATVWAALRTTSPSGSPTPSRPANATATSFSKMTPSARP